MSYSFEVTGTTKADVITAAKVETDKVVANQPIHAADMVAVVACIEGLVASLADDTSADVVVSAYGSCSGKGSTASEGLEYAQANVTVKLRAVQQP